MDEEDSSDDTFDYEQFLLAEQVRKYYYHGLYPAGIFVIWTLLRADCYNLSGCDSLGNPPILYASKCGSLILLRLLLHYKADINALSKHRETALIVACRNKRMKAIKLLLKRGAQTDLQDKTGYSPLRWAVIHQHVDMVKLLLRYNASVTTDCYTSGSAIDIARQGTSKEHTIILNELEKKLVVEREALLVDVIERKKQDAISETRAYREKQNTTAATNPANSADLAAQSTTKATKRSRKQSSHKVIAGIGISRRPSCETSVGMRVPTPLAEQVTWESSLGDINASSDWVKVATGKWQTRRQKIGIPISAAEATTVEVFAPVEAPVCKLLTSNGKWEAFLAQQMPHKVSQAQLTIEDLEASGEGKSCN